MLYEVITRVRDGQVTLRHDQRHLPGDLEFGLVEAREGLARVIRLELAVRVVAAAALQPVA